MKFAASRWDRRKTRDVSVGLTTIIALGVTSFAGLGLDLGHDRGSSTVSRVASVGTLRQLGQLAGTNETYRALTATPDGKQAVSVGADNLPRVWELDSGDELRTLTGSSARIGCAAVAPDGTSVAFGADDGSVWISSLEAQKPPRQFAGHEDSVTCLAFEPLGGYLLSAGKDRAIRIWDVNTGAALSKVFRLKSVVTCLSATLDGRHLLSGSQNGEVTLWRMSDAGIAFSLRGQGAAILALAVTPDGREAFSLANDGDIRQWNLEKGTLIEQVRYPLSDNDQISCAAFSIGMTRLLVGTSNKELGLWNLPAKLLERTACELSGTPQSAVILMGGMHAVAAIADQSPTIFDLLLPSALEVERSQSISKTLTTRGDQLQSYADQMKQGAKAVDDQDSAAAKTAFTAARESAPAGTLYRVSAEQAFDGIAKAERKGESYRQHLEAGRKAVEAKNHALARREFQQARDIFPDRSEATDALRKVDEADELGGLFTSATFEQTLGFDFEPGGKKLLDLGHDFAYLIVSRDRDPPLGLASSPLTWRVQLTLRRAVPREGLQIETRVTRVADNKPIGSSRSPLKVGQTAHTLLGSAAAPAEGWKVGEYEFRSFLVAEGRHEELGTPKRVPMAMLRWTEHDFEVTPQAVRRSGFEIRTGLRLEDDSAVRVKVTGQITPARLDFYREVTGDSRLKEPLPVSPAGLPWSANNRALSHYSIVDPKKPWAALLGRVSGVYSSPWFACQSDGASSDVPIGGELILSINSVNGLRTKNSLPFKPPKDDKHWLPDCGAFQVRVLLPHFETTSTLPSGARREALKRY